MKAGGCDLRLRFCRVICSECGHAHALLLSSIVPYSQVSLPDQVDIIQHDWSDADFSAVMDATPSIDESCVRSVIRRFRRHWEQDKKHAIALMRYSVIAPLITGMQEDYPSLNAFFRDASVKGVTAPDGSVRKYAPATIKKWYLSYKHGGFDALLPTGRSDAGKPRKLDDAIQQQIRCLKVNYPPYVCRGYLPAAAG